LPVCVPASSMVTSSRAASSCCGSKLSFVSKPPNRAVNTSPSYLVAKASEEPGACTSSAACAGAASIDTSMAATAAGVVSLLEMVGIPEGGGGRAAAGQHAPQGVVALEDVVVEGGAGMHGHEQDQDPEQQCVRLPGQARKPLVGS